MASAAVQVSTDFPYENGRYAGLVWTDSDVFGLVSGAQGRTRTGMTLRSRDFKSLASTSSATSALVSRDQILSAFSGEVELG